MGRHLILLVDGTRVSASQAGSFQSYSNVYELGYMLRLRDRSEDGKPQVVFYTSGISSQPGTRDLLTAATGSPIKAQILDQYTNLCSNYDFDQHGDPAKRDKIYLFGFSRGAMAARALAGLIMEFGLLRPEHIRYAPIIVEDWQNNEARPGDVDLTPVDVEFLGVFDSVMGGISRLKVFNPIRFPHNRLGGRCKHGIHILAMDEDRRFFANRSWECHGKQGKKPQDGVMRQIWMPGVHSDVGGTASELWGRASFLAMTHYIDTLTDLQLDRTWVKRKEDNVRADIESCAMKVRQHRPPPPFRTQRSPGKQPAAEEFLHPVIAHLPDAFRYNEKSDFPWKERRFGPVFGELPMEPQLEAYFARFLA